MGANRLDRRSVPSVGYIVRSYPRLSQTFILDELRALERLGVPIHIFAMTDPREEVTQAEGGVCVTGVEGGEDDVGHGAVIIASLCGQRRCRR